METALAGNIAIAGAWASDELGSAAGSASIFDIVTGQRLYQLFASDATAGDNFGFRVAIDSDRAIVGAWHDGDNGVDSGSAYLFECTPGLVLSAASECPEDGPATLSATGGTGGLVAFVYSAQGSGSFIIPNGALCAGTELALQDPVVVTGTASGNPAVLDVHRVPAFACGTVAVQAINVDTCVTSNVLTFN